MKKDKKNDSINKDENDQMLVDDRVFAETVVFIAKELINKNESVEEKVVIV